MSDRDDALEEAAKLAAGEPFKENYRRWPWWGTGDRSIDSELVQFCDALATAIRALKREPSPSVREDGMEILRVVAATPLWRDKYSDGMEIFDEGPPNLTPEHVRAARRIVEVGKEVVPPEPAREDSRRDDTPPPPSGPSPEEGARNSAFVETERRAFEEWFEADQMPLEHSNWFSRDDAGDYVIDFVEECWRGWIARALASPSPQPAPAAPDVAVPSPKIIAEALLRHVGQSPKGMPSAKLFLQAAAALSAQAAEIVAMTREIALKDKDFFAQHAALAAKEADHASALSFIRTLGEELVLAGMPGGDRDVILENVRGMRAALAAKEAECERLRGQIDHLLDDYCHWLDARLARHKDRSALSGKEAER